MVDSTLLEIMACPVCHGDLEYDLKKEMISCQDCGRMYPVEQGIPVMLPERAIEGKPAQNG